MNNTPYTYLIRHIASGNLYHGSRTKKGCNPDELLKEKGYKTSSKIIKSIIEDQGLEAFEIINIEIFDNIENARLAEQIYHKKYDVKGNVYYFNQWNAGEKFSTSGVPRTEEEKRKQSLAMTGKMIREKNPMFGKPKSQSTITKLRIANSGENHPMFGKPRSEETKQKISNALSGENHYSYGKSLSNEHKKKISISNIGKSLTDEQREKLSLSKIGKSYSKTMCPHCGKEGGANAMSRYHFNNCRKKT